MENNELTKKKYGAWKKQTSKGEVINFTIEGKRYSMWVNTYKTESRHPDYQIFEDHYVMQKESKDLPF
jgi:hypothetical protein